MIRGRIATPDRDPKTWRSRGRKKRKRPALAQAIVTPAKPIKGPVIRQPKVQPVELSDDATTNRTTRPGIVEPKRKRSSVFGPVPDFDAEEHQRRREAAGELWREMVRRVNAKGD